MNLKVVSGGQTGIDRMGLEVARKPGLPTGGTAPKGYRTEDGPDTSLAAFGLREHPKPAYVQRTRQNVMNSDGTVLYGDTEPRGCKATIAHGPRWQRAGSAPGARRACSASRRRRRRDRNSRCGLTVFNQIDYLYTADRSSLFY